MDPTNPHLHDPFPSFYSHTFSKVIAAPETYYYINPSKCSMTMDPNRVGQITVTPLNGMLSDGGVFQDPSGAIVGVVEGTLAQPLPVTLRTTDAPAPPLPGGTHVGNYYHLAAEHDALAPIDKPFLLGLPVPAGVAGDALAVAVLLPLGSALGVAADKQVWMFSTGRYDPENNLFVITLSALKAAGLTVTLVSDPAFTPAPPIAPVGGQRGELPPRFTVSCGPSSTACTETNRAWLRGELENAYADFVTGLHFKEPVLQKKGGFKWFNGTWLAFLETADSYSNVWLYTRPCDAPEYEPTQRSINICLDAQNAPGNYEQRVVRHELFHAIQHAYPNVALDWDDPDALWTIEGTATAAECSSATMQRTRDYLLHTISDPLPFTDKKSQHEYHAQDFWVYKGMNPEQSLAYLQAVFNAGATPQHVNTVLPLDDAYWAWAKNQAFEKTETFARQLTIPACADEDLTSPFTESACAPESNLTGTHIPLSLPSEAVAEVRLAPLSSAVVEITLTQSVAYLEIWAHDPNGSANLRYKIYWNSNTPCTTMSDGIHYFGKVPAGAKRYVLLSNVSVSQTLGAIVTVVID